MISVALFVIQITILLAVTTLVLRFSRHYPRWTSALGPVLLGFAAALVVSAASGFDPRISLRFDSMLGVASDAVTASEPKTKPVSTEVERPSTTPSPSGSNAETPGPLVSVAGLTQWLAASLKLEPTRPRASKLVIGFWVTLGLIAGLQLLRLLHGTRRVHGLCASCHPSGRLRQSAASILGSDSPEIWLGDEVHSPFVFWRQPNRIYLPREFESFSRSDQNAVLAHEYAHLRRWDPGVRLFVDCAMVLLGWHPLAWRIRRQIEEAQEMAADFEAATTLGDLHQYRRALSNWLLWMDQQLWKEPRYCVSFSANSAVRRIKMLKQISGRTANTRLVIVSVALIGTAMFCSGWKLRADDKTKLASAKLSKSTARDEQLFQGGGSAPWNTVGDRVGYYHIHKGAFSQSPFLQNLIVASVFPYTPNLSQAMVREVFDNFESIEGNLVPQAKKLSPEEVKENGHEHQLLCGATVFSTRFGQAIDWTKYAAFLDVKAWLGTDENVEWEQELRDAIAGTGSSKTLLLGKTSPSDEQTSGDGFATASERSRIEALWKLVDGGQATAACINPMNAEFLATSLDADSEPTEELLKSVGRMIDVVAVGVDCHDDIFTQSIRVAAHPRDSSAKELEAAVLKLREVYLTEIEVEEPEDANAEKFLESQRHMWGGLRTEVVSTSEGDAVLVHFEHVLNLVQTVAYGDQSGPGKPLQTLPKKR